MLTPYSEVRPCCRFDTNIYDESFVWDGESKLTDFYQSDLFAGLRKDIEEGKPIKGCHRCYQEEELNIPSMRTKPFPVEIDDLGEKEFSYRFVELGVGKKCNLKCRSCNASFSSKWISDAEALKMPYSGDNSEIDLNSIPIQFFKETKSIKVTGGEPFLHNSFSELLKRLNESGYSKEIELEIFTNTTVFPSGEVVESLLSFKHLQISSSIDGVEKVNTYLRHPIRWEKYLETIRKWRRLEIHNPNVDIFLVNTVSIYNIMHTFKFIDWAYDFYYPHQPDIIFQIVHDPSYMNVSRFPEDVKFGILDHFFDESHKVYSKWRLSPILEKRLKQLKKLIHSKTENSEVLEEFWQKTEALDRLRKESFKDVFPELDSLLRRKPDE